MTMKSVDVVVRPNQEELPPSSSYNEITVYGVRQTGNSSFYQIWVQNSVEGFTKMIGVGTDAFFSGSNNDPMQIVKLKWANAIAKLNLTTEQSQQITGLLDKLSTAAVFGQLESAAGGGRALVVIKGALPNGSVGRSDFTQPGQVIVTLDIDKISSLDLDEHAHHFDNVFAGTVLHEMLHIARPDLNHMDATDPRWPAMSPENSAAVNDQIWGDFVQQQRTTPGSASYDWLGQMDAMGRAANLINDSNARYWWPVVLDLGGTGPALVDKNAGVKFDVHTTGTPTATGWVAKGGSLLAVDWNHDGRISTGNEISFARFGNDPNSDLKGLAALDQNHDGKIDAKDAIFAQLLVWTDRNGDGLSSADELKSLAQAGVDSIELKIQDLQLLQHGNMISGQVLVHLANGAVVHAYDVGFGL